MASALTVCVARSLEAATTRRLPGEFSLYLCAAPSFFAHLPPLPNISAPTHSSPRCDSTETPPEVLAQAFSPRRRRWRRRCPPLTLPLPPLSRQAAEKATPVLADDQFLISRRVVSERAASQKDVGKRELQGGWRQEGGWGGRQRTRSGGEPRGATGARNSSEKK